MACVSDNPSSPRFEAGSPVDVEDLRQVSDSPQVASAYREQVSLHLQRPLTYVWLAVLHGGAHSRFIGDVRAAAVPRCSDEVPAQISTNARATLHAAHPAYTALPAGHTALTASASVGRRSSDHS